MPKSIIADESAFERLAQGEPFPYSQLVRAFFYEKVSLYLVPETIEYLYREKIILPPIVYEPFHTLVPDPETVAESAAWAQRAKIPVHRALIVNLSLKLRLSVGLCYSKNYLGLGLRRRYFLRPLLQ